MQRMIVNSFPTLFQLKKNESISYRYTPFLKEVFFVTVLVVQLKI